MQTAITESLEMHIASAVLMALSAKSYSFNADDENGEELKTPTRSCASIFKRLKAGAQFLVAIKDKRQSWVKFVWGNGCDVISDFTTDLESILKPINDFCAAYDRGEIQPKWPAIKL